MRLAVLVLIVASFVSPAMAGDPGAGETVFKKCAVCHMIGEGAHTRIGPELNGLIGRPSASIDGFNYSDAMKSAHLTWDVKTFSTYIADPKALVPGTKMTFGGLSDPQDIDNLVAYLSQFAPDGLEPGMQVLYFAWLRERLNRGSDEIDPPPSVTTVGDLMDWICQHDEAAALAMTNRKIIRAAVDDAIVGHEHPIAGARRVALFPPMTGG